MKPSLGLFSFFFFLFVCVCPPMLTLYHSPTVTGEARLPEGKAEVSFLVLGASTKCK